MLDLMQSHFYKSAFLFAFISLTLSITGWSDQKELTPYNIYTLQAKTDGQTEKNIKYRTFFGLKCLILRVKIIGNV